MTAVLVVAAAVGVYVATSSSSSSDGAASPEAAVRDAAAAIANQNPSALLDVMDPGEVKSLGALLSLIRGKVAKTDVVAASGQLEPWLTLSQGNLTLTTEPATSTLSFVEITGGTVAATVDQKSMPDTIRPPDPTTVHQQGSLAGAATANHGKPIEIATIKVGGRWYISPTTTGLANAQIANGLPAPDFTHPAALGDGSDTPQGALTGYDTALSKNDYAAAAGYISASDVPELPYYYDSLAGKLPQEGEQFQGATSTMTTTTQPMSDGLVKVIITGATEKASGISGSYRDGCLSSSALPRTLCIPATFTTLSGLQNPFVVVEEHNGKWQISTIATYLEYLRVIFTDGSINAVYRVLHLGELTPVVATLSTGKTSQVRLNDAGFAHVHIVGKAGACIPDSDGDGIQVESSGFGPFADLSEGSASESFNVGNGSSTSLSCNGFTVPDGGTFDGIVTSSHGNEFGKTINLNLSS